MKMNHLIFLIDSLNRKVFSNPSFIPRLESETLSFIIIHQEKVQPSYAATTR